MKKQLLNLTMLLIVLLMGGGSALGAEVEKLELSATQTTVLRNLENADKVLYSADYTSWNTNQAKISAGKITNYQNKTGNDNETYFIITKFDLSKIPSGATLTSATLSFESKCTVSEKNSQPIVAKFGAEWEGETATWNNVDKTATAIATLNSSGSTAKTSQTCDVRSYLNEKIADNKSAVGFAIYTYTAREQNIDNIKLNIEYSSAAVEEFSYTVNATCGETKIKVIESGKVLSTDNKVVYFPLLLNVGDVWYKTSEKSYSVAIDGNVNKNIPYEKVTNIVAFAEGESAVANSSYNTAYSSGRDGHAAGKGNLSIGTIPAGKYKMIGMLTGNGKRGIYLRDLENSDVSNNTICNLDINRSSKAGEYSVEFTINQETKVGATGYTSETTTNQSADFDYIYIVKTADVLSLSTDYTYSTYTPSSDVNLTNEDGVEFYAAAVNGNKVELTKVEGAVKAGTGLLVKNTEKVASVTLATAAEGSEVSNNDLVGVTEDKDAAALVADNAYILVDDNTFQKVGAEATDKLAKGKAYLRVSSTAAQARQIFISNPTAVNAVAEKGERTENVIYNMQGMRVKNADASGLYIVNGKKYIKK